MEPVPSGAVRPQWSVMMSTYNGTAYLPEALRSVLQQDPGLDVMQIEVVDDFSTLGHPEAVVAESAAAASTTSVLPPAAQHGPER